MLPPQWLLLHQLTVYPSVAALWTSAMSSRTIHPVMPYVLSVDEHVELAGPTVGVGAVVNAIALPGDCSHPETTIARTSLHRIEIVATEAGVVYRLVKRAVKPGPGAAKL